MPWEESESAWDAGREPPLVSTPTWTRPTIHRPTASRQDFERSSSRYADAAVTDWVRSVDLGKSVGGAILKAVHVLASGGGDPPLRSTDQGALDQVRSLTRAQLDAALREARLEGLADDLWGAIERLRVV